MSACDTIAKSELIQRNFTSKYCVQLSTLYVNVMHCNYSRHSLSRILRGMEKNTRQPEFELKIQLWKPEVITGCQGMVKMKVKWEGAKLKPSLIAQNKQITDT